MAQTGFTPISNYYSATATNVPTAGNLVAGELAINTADGKLFYKDSSGVVQTLATKDATSGSFTNLAYTGTLTGGTGVVNLGSGQFYKDASGNVGIGTATPQAKLHANSANNATSLLLTPNSGSSAGDYTQLGFGNSASSGTVYGGIRTAFLSPAGSSAVSMQFWTDIGSSNYAERMRISSSGDLLIGTTSNSALQNNNSFIIRAVGDNIQNHVAGTASGSGYTFFGYNGSAIGSITQNGTTGVLYNLTSDYRLKDNATPLTGASKFIMALQPKSWDWWDGSGKGVGFIAHEFMEVAKYSGNGKKDEVEIVDDVDAEGKVIGTKEVPKYQSIQPSSSEVMANLVALVQEQQALIESLTTRLTALEAK